jgi:NAD-dependent dihydropyrimidine dehydrogenase PreA subunit
VSGVVHTVTVLEEACTGCGACVELCPPDVLRLSEAGKASVAYPDDCEACYLCELACAFRAIDVRVSLSPELVELLRSYQ